MQNGNVIIHGTGCSGSTSGKHQSECRDGAMWCRLCATETDPHEVTIEIRNLTQELIAGVTIDDMLDELERRYIAVQMSLLRHTKEGSDSKAIDNYYRGGLAPCLGLAIKQVVRLTFSEKVGE